MYGKTQAPIVGSMKGLSFYRGSYATWKKKHAHRAHRHRVKADLGVQKNIEEFDDAPRRSEQCDSWDLW